MDSYTRILDNIWVKTVKRFSRRLPDARRVTAENFAREKFFNMSLPYEEKYLSLVKKWKIQTNTELIIAARICWLSETKLFNTYARA